MSERVAIVDGLRTPFARRGDDLAAFDAVDLGTSVVSELVERNGLDGSDVDQVAFGRVILDVELPNIAREIVLNSPLPDEIEAYSVSEACITSYRTAVNAAASIASGNADVVIAGGVDTLSHAPVVVTDQLQAILNRLADARSVGERARLLSKLRPGDLVPKSPDLEEPSTGETMGEAAERMAKMNGITRDEQDDFAHRSHSLAAQAWERGDFDDEVLTLMTPPDYADVVDRDLTVRFDSDRGAYRKLKPSFDRKHGTLTAGNSTPLTDGAAALLMMSETRASEMGLKPLGFLRSSAFTAVDPAGQLLIGPVFATPVALDRAGVKLGDIDLIDMHEAFAAQVLSVIKSFESREFAADKMGRPEPIGEIDWNILNVAGGSIAIGHPFAATGARQISQTLRELRRRDGELALCTACAAGGLGAALVLETA
ncbi:MAG: acetyl-CoA C-acyltransferase FadI [Actinomycetota bacterium]